MEIVRRHIRADLEDALLVSRVVALVGPRQAGKSTLAALVAQEVLGARPITLDDDATRNFAREDPVGFVASLRSPAVIDEIQRAPEVMLAIKARVDRDPTPGQFLLTGSADLRRLATIPDALPGRVEYLDLWPFSQGEIGGFVETFLDDLKGGRPPLVDAIPVGAQHYAELIAAGGFPASIPLSPRRRVGFFRSYLSSLLGRDLPDVAGIRRPEVLERLLSLIAARAGSFLNLTGLASELRIDAKTVESYGHILDQLGLVVRLPAWFSNLGHRVVKAPKLHVADSGLHTYLIGAHAEGLAGNPKLVGPALESFVVAEVTRQRGWAIDPPLIFHMRTHEGVEVDIVLQWRDGGVAGIETKSAASVAPRDFRGLQLLRDRLGDAFVCGVVLYTGERTLPAGDRLWAVPVSGLWTPAPAG